MRYNLITRFFLISLLLSFVAVPIACSKDDVTPDTDPVGDPTNTKTTIKANTPQGSGAVLTSTITVQLAESDGTLLTISGGTVVLSTTGSAELSAVTDNGNGTYSATISSNMDETVTVSGTLKGSAITDTAIVIFNPDDSNPVQEVAQSTVPLGPSIIRINSGGPQVTFGDITFLADQYFEGPTEAFANPFVTTIAETEMDELFLTERVTNNTNFIGPFSYAIPITNGTYTVKLYFAEIYWGVTNPDMFEGGTGSRLFNISMEDTNIFTAYDIHKEVGSASATSRMYDIEVTDGELNIIFKATLDKPKVSAIEIFGIGTIGS